MATGTSATGTGERRSEAVDVGGLEMHLQSAGEWSGTPVVVLHHSTGPLWTPFHDRLAERRRVVVPDLPGYGRSARPVTARAPRDLAIRALQLFDVLGVGPVHLVGLGLGGWVAAEMATMHQSALSSLVLVGAAGIKPRTGEIFDPMMSSPVTYGRRCFSADERFDALFGEEPSPELAEVWDWSREMTARITWRPWMWSGQLPDLLRGVRTPALVVWGDTDRVVPIDCGQQYAELLPAARLETVAAAGHCVDLEQPDALASVVERFFDEQEG